MVDRRRNQLARHRPLEHELHPSNLPVEMRPAPLRPDHLLHNHLEGTRAELRGWGTSVQAGKRPQRELVVRQFARSPIFHLRVTPEGEDHLIDGEVWAWIAGDAAAGLPLAGDAVVLAPAGSAV